MSEKRLRWGHASSADAEEWSDAFPTREAAIEAGKKEYERDFYIASARPADPTRFLPTVDEILETMKERAHDEVYCLKELDLMLYDARAGRHFRLVVGLVEPEDHTKDYDCVIQMLEMSVRDKVTLSQREFSQYVLDDWGWKGQFINVTSNYRQNR